MSERGKPIDDGAYTTGVEAYRAGQSLYELVERILTDQRGSGEAEIEQMSFAAGFLDGLLADIRKIAGA